MNDGEVTVRMPSEQELSHIRELWLRCGPTAIHDAPSLSLELKHYMEDSLRFIGMLAGLHPVTGEAVFNQFPLTVSEVGVKRLHNRVRLCTAIMALWTVRT
jgi:hypothetical protein